MVGCQRSSIISLRLRARALDVNDDIGVGDCRGGPLVAMRYVHSDYTALFGVGVASNKYGLSIVFTTVHIFRLFLAHLMNLDFHL